VLQGIRNKIKHNISYGTVHENDQFSLYWHITANAVNISRQKETNTDFMA